MRQLFKSRFFAAAIAFGALSLLAGAAGFCRALPSQFPYKSWTAWAIEDFLQKPQAPQVVFMGSSLVLVPVAGVDADYLQHRLDGSEHHNSAYFEDKFAQKTGIKANTFNFALPGEMPSDACLITRFLLKDKHKPDVIVYGVGPRDFMDNLLPSPAATDPFRFLSRFGDINQWAALMMPQPLERFSYEMGRFIYFYGHKVDIADRLLAAAGKQVDDCLPLPRGAQPMPAEQIHAMLPEYRPFELQRGQAFFRPSTPEELSKFVDNLGEYRKRYKTLNWDTFLTQMRFFTETLAAARENGTHAVVVAMPITDLNRQLLSDLSWDAYRSSIKAIAQREGASFIDFSEDPSFMRSHFGDTVHLHAVGGRLWLDKVIERMAQDSAVAASLNHSDTTVAESRHGGAL